VVVQDTNLGMPHAILAVASEQDVWILDNQAASIVAERNIEHYAPVYSISGRQWWLHMPPGEAMASASLSRARSPALP
jgi:predicted transglutaminase-like cysteine proteinase